MSPTRTAATSTILTNDFFGFTGETFNQIQINAGGSNNAFLLDNLESNPAVIPEPASLSLLGIGAVWIYAAIRPRYGAGPSTAVRAGLTAWALAVFLANLSYYPLGVFPERLLVITTIVALFEIVIGTVAGAWLYTEEAGKVEAASRAAA